MAFFVTILLILASSYIITLEALPLIVLGAFLLLFLAFSLAMLFRELIVPSWIEKNDNVIVVRWNNWRLDGTLAGAGFEGKRKLSLTIDDIKITITPVGPLMGLAGLALKPLLGLFLPAFLAQSYYFKKESLLKNIRIDEQNCKLVFPAFLLGKRKVKKWLG
jgi:hypothetical protein